MLYNKCLVNNITFICVIDHRRYPSYYYKLTLSVCYTSGQTAGPISMKFDMEDTLALEEGHRLLFIAKTDIHTGGDLAYYIYSSIYIAKHFYCSII